MNKPIEELFENLDDCHIIVDWLNQKAKQLESPYFTNMESFMKQEEQREFILDCFQFVELIKSLGYEPTSKNHEADPQDQGEP